MWKILLRQTLKGLHLTRNAWYGFTLLDNQFYGRAKDGYCLIPFVKENN